QDNARLASTRRGEPLHQRGKFPPAPYECWLTRRPQHDVGPRVLGQISCRFHRRAAILRWPERLSNRVGPDGRGSEVAAAHSQWASAVSSTPTTRRRGDGIKTSTRR